ncbi:hypothetical protein EUX98_g9047 [Antrodiella citrinella]|uniref:F-box domain-containing protein n=1 Tax=Antrodiella citrinella TaxID=2447956 RepID=A0A4S4LZA9_9APHY|nr:hypothetical protein EUX98_g9047 [Antrodiella citrinella]
MLMITEWTPDSIQTMSSFTLVTHLSLSECILPANILFGIISALPSLKDLEVDLQLDQADEMGNEAISFKHVPKLDQLMFYHERGTARTAQEPENLIEFLMRRGCLDSIRVLNVGICNGDAEVVGRLLNKLGDHLEDLRIDFPGLEEELDATDLTRNIHFEKNTKPQHLQFFEHPSRHPIMPTLLRRVASPHIQTVWFNHTPANVESMQPEILEQILLSPKYSSLSGVRFTINCGARPGDNKPEYDMVAQSYRSAFAELQRKGILRLDQKFLYP